MITAYPTLRLKLTMPTALKLQFLPAVPGFNASQVANKVNRTGDTMSGQLFLAADPSFSMEAATKQYVDTHSGAGVADGDKGDVTVSSSGTTWTIDADAVTYAKMQNVSAASRLIGRGSASGAGDPEEITLGTNLTMTGTVLSASGGGGTATVVAPQGRLTLQTATPVMTTSTAGATTIFYTAYVGNLVPLYNGSTFDMTAFGADLSNVTTASSVGSAGPAAVAASSVYDLFIWSNGGTPMLTRGPAWTNDTTRSAGTILTRVNNIWINSVAITNGPAASRGTYVGTTRSNSASQFDWIYPVTGNPAISGLFLVWNMYNRVRVCTLHGSSIATQAYAIAAYRPYFNDQGLRISFVSGLAEDTFEATVLAQVIQAAGGAPSVGVGYDTIAAFSGLSTQNYSGNAMNILSPVLGMHNTTATGVHFFQMMQMSDVAGGTFYGASGGGLIQTGITFAGRM